MQPKEHQNPDTNDRMQLSTNKKCWALAGADLDVIAFGAGISMDLKASFNGRTKTWSFFRLRCLQSPGLWLCPLAVGLTSL